MATTKFTVEYPNIPEIVTRLATITKRMEKEARAILDEEGTRTVTEQRLRTPRDTGLLSANNSSYIIQTPGDISMTLSNSTKYARFVEFGTGERGAMAPAEFFPSDLEWAYGTRLGYRARPFFYPPAIAASGRITSRFDDLTKKEAEYATDVKQIGTLSIS